MMQVKLTGSVNCSTEKGGTDPNDGVILAVETSNV